MTDAKNQAKGQSLKDYAITASAEVEQQHVPGMVEHGPMSGKSNALQQETLRQMRPDHWLTETTTPDLLMQTDVNSGKTEPVLAGAATLSEGQHNRADFDQTIAPLKTIREQTDVQALYDFLFLDEDSEATDYLERKRRLRLLAQEMEMTASHIRRVIFSARNRSQTP